MNPEAHNLSSQDTLDTGKSSTDQKTEREESRDSSRLSFRDNVERHKDSIAGYLEKGMVENLPKDYQEKYRQVLDKHAEELQPINPKCKFTLVLPAFREERIIRQTLESLQNQEGVDLDDFEVIVVNNYPEGEKPRLNDYDETGKKIGDHEDRTTAIVNEFAGTSDLKVQVVEQSFPEEIKGVGIASKLGMDLALRRQAGNSQVIGYYGADTIFDSGWVRGVFDGFAKEDIDGVRGATKSGQISNRVEDEHGLHILSDEELGEILELAKRRHSHWPRVYELEDILRGKKTGVAPKQRAGLATVTAGMYAKIGGMKAYSARQGGAVTTGEDWQIAQDVADNGKIFWNKDMKAVALGRIEKPRAKGGSYTESLWKMYRAYKYGEGGILDKDKNIIVEDPGRYVEWYKLKKAIEEMSSGRGSSEARSHLLEYLAEEEVDQIEVLMEKHRASWRDRVPRELERKVEDRLDERFPKMKLEDAEKKLDEMIAIK